MLPWKARRAGTAIVCGIALVTLSCGRPADRPDSLVLIVVDTMRGDRLGCTGCEAARTPVMDSLAAAGTLFTDAMTPVPVTLSAVSSLLTGRLPFHHGVRDNERFVLPEDETTLAEIFRKAGYRTGAVLGSAVLAKDRGLTQGFERYDDDFAPPFPVYDPTLRPLAAELARSQRRADAVTTRALSMIETFDGKPFFLLVHYFDPHMFYDPPPEFQAMHPGRPYDAEISFVDREVGRLLAGLSRRPGALVALVGDHGESNGEHGEPQHGFLLYQSTLHVPIIVSGPGVPRGFVRRDPVSLVDLEPTLRSAFRLPEAGKERDGRTLEWGREETGAVLYAETFRPLVSYGWSQLRAVRSGSWKLISGPSTEVYNLERDPDERTDLADSGPAARLAVDMARLVGGDDPESVLRAATGRPEPERASLLAGLGYISGPASTTPARPDPRTELPKWLDRQKAKTLAKEAVLRIDEETPARALDLLDEALRLDPGLADAHYLRGVARLRTGDRRGARKAFEECAAVDPHHLGAASELARMAEDSGRFDVAYEQWHHVAEVKPDSTSVRYRLGILAERLGRHEEAIENFEAVVRDAPESEEATEAQRAIRIISEQ